MNLEDTLAAYVRRRLGVHFEDRYHGRPLCKFPEDLHSYETMMWEMSANAVIELGVQHGGSTLWFRDRLRSLGGGLVVAVDIAPNPGLPRDGIVFLQADVRDPELPARVARILEGGRLRRRPLRPFVIEDSAHTYETTRAALEGFAPLVPDGGYFVVEDAVVDVEVLRLRDDWPRGVTAAIDDFLGAHPEFVRVPSMYEVTCSPGGFLRRAS